MRIRPAIAAFAALAFVAGASSAQAARPTTADPRWQHVEEGGDDLCDPDTFDKMFPFTLNDNLHPAVDDIVVTTYLLNILPFGGLWGPLVTLPDAHPDMKAGDVLVAYIVPYLVGCGTNFVLGSWTGLFLIPGTFLACYTAPTAALNGWDRAYKCGGQKKSAPKKKAAPKPDDGGEGYAY